jgi:hypothetical protein
MRLPVAVLVVLAATGCGGAADRAAQPLRPCSHRPRRSGPVRGPPRAAAPPAQCAAAAFFITHLAHRRAALRVDDARLRLTAPGMR